jgi:5'(3')-deoxyribonucleotidase
MTALRLDCDGVIADFPAGCLRWLNGRSVGPSAFKLDDIDQHDILKAFQLDHEQEKFDQWCIDTDYCRHIPVYPGAQDFVEELRKLGELVIVTSPYAVPAWMNSRLAWLKEHFDIDKRDVVFCKRKELVRGSMLIDDKVENAEAFGQVPGQIGALFSQPWNASHSGGFHVRVNGYAGALRLVREYREAAGL